MLFFPFFFSWHGLVTLLSETNYAGCQSSSLSNRLCCCGSLEGRSFILLSTPICPGGFCSSVAESVPPLCLFISLSTSTGCVSACGGVGEMERERDRERESVFVCPCLCAETAACAGSSAWFMRVCVLVHRYRRMCCFHDVGLCLCSTHSRLMAYRSCNTFFSFNTISKPQHSPPDFLNYLFNPQCILHWKSGRHYRTVMLSWSFFANSETKSYRAR